MWLTDPKMDIAPLDMCVNALASGLKSFFKLLPQPLISEDMGNELLTVASELILCHVTLAMVFLTRHFLMKCDYWICETCGTIAVYWYL